MYIIACSPSSSSKLEKIWLAYHETTDGLEHLRSEQTAAEAGHHTGAIHRGAPSQGHELRYQKTLVVRLSIRRASTRLNRGCCSGANVLPAATFANTSLTLPQP